MIYHNGKRKRKRQSVLLWCSLAIYSSIQWCLYDRFMLVHHINSPFTQVTSTQQYVWYIPICHCKLCLSTRMREREHHMIWHYRENRVLRTRCEGETTVSLIIIIILIINNGVRYYAGSFMKNDLSQWQTQEKEINPSYAGILSFLYFKEASRGPMPSYAYFTSHLISR